MLCILRGEHYLCIDGTNAYREGLGAKWTDIAQYWSNPQSHPEQVDAFLSFESTRGRHIAGPKPERYNPGTWTDEFGVLSRPGERAIQMSLLYDHGTNVAAYPVRWAWLRKAQPPTLVLWGRYDSSFISAGARAYGRDLPGAEIHLPDAGHFALDEKVDEIARRMIAFLAALP